MNLRRDIKVLLKNPFPLEMISALFLMKHNNNVLKYIPPIISKKFNYYHNIYLILQNIKTYNNFEQSND